MILVQYVITSMLIYILMALELPLCALKSIDKVRREFLWKGRKDAVGGGCCLLAWPKVTKLIILAASASLTSKYGMGPEAHVVVATKNRT